jgi:hypothetical protein
VIEFDFDDARINPGKRRSVNECEHELSMGSPGEVG